MTALICDYDGLIVDSERLLGECMIELLASMDAEVSFIDFGHLFGSIDVDHEWERLVALWSKDEMTLAEFDEKLTPIYRARAESLPLLPGVGELVTAAKDAGWALGLATGQNRHRLMPRLERLGLSRAFGAIVTRADVPNGKPAPDIFVAVAERLDADPSDCVVSEDSSRAAKPRSPRACASLSVHQPRPSIASSRLRRSALHRWPTSTWRS